MLSCVVLSRGPDGFLLDLKGFNDYWHMKSKTGVEEYFYVCLRRKVKEEHKVTCRILPCIAITGSGINVKEGVGMLLELKASQGFVAGPVISDIHGRVASTHAVNDCLMGALEA